MGNIVNYKQAVSLKNLGFDKWGDYIYTNESTITPVIILSYDYKGRDNCFPAPTLSLVQKWFREQFNYVISIIKDLTSENSWQYFYEHDGNIRGSKGFNTYEDALSAAIDEVIEVLKNEIRIKGQSIDTWIEWLNNELEPPHDLEDDQVYVLEAFLEALKILRKG